MKTNKKYVNYLAGEHLISFLLHQECSKINLYQLTSKINKFDAKNSLIPMSYSIRTKRFIHAFIPIYIMFKSIAQPNLTENSMLEIYIYQEYDSLLKSELKL